MGVNVRREWVRSILQGLQHWCFSGRIRFNLLGRIIGPYVPYCVCWIYSVLLANKCILMCCSLRSAELLMGKAVQQLLNTSTYYNVTIVNGGYPDGFFNGVSWFIMFGAWLWKLFQNFPTIFLWSVYVLLKFFLNQQLKRVVSCWMKFRHCKWAVPSF